jgi:hypothetical protein
MALYLPNYRNFNFFFTFSASGEVLPPMVLYKSQQGRLIDSWTKSGPDGVLYEASSTGTFNVHYFNLWFRDVSLTVITTKIGKLYLN